MTFELYPYSDLGPMIPAHKEQVIGSFGLEEISGITHTESDPVPS